MVPVRSRPFWLAVVVVIIASLLGPTDRFLPAAGAQGAGLEITEFVAANAAGLADNTGAVEDWIELYNPTAAPIDLAGWSLADDATVHVFGSELVPAGGYLVVFASGEPTRTVSGEPHVDFKLKASGDELVLRAPNGSISGQAWAPYPPQVADVSYGVDGSGQQFFFDPPTPGAANGTGASGVVAAPESSVAHGFHTSPFSLTLTSPTPGVTLRYTTDGSTPTATSGTAIAPGQPLPISATTTLRVRAFRSGWVPSSTRTWTHLFPADIAVQPETTPPGWPDDPAPPNNQRMIYGMDPDLVAGNEAAIEQSLRSLPALSVVTDLPHLFDPATGIYANPREKGREWEAPISLELIDPSGAEQGFTIDGGFRVRGASTRSPVVPKHNFGFFFRDEYGGSLDYPLFGTEGVDTFEKVDLRSAQGIDWARLRDPQNTIMRELWMRDTQAAMGQPYTRSRYYHLYINGQYWGVYLTQERVGDHYGEQYFGGNESDYDVVKHDYNTHPVTGESPSKRYLATDGDGAAWESLHPLVIDQVVDDAEFAILESQVDLVNLADYYVAHIWAGNLDGAPDPGTGGRSNNWFALRNRTGQGVAGKWQFFQHDQEASLCYTRPGFPEFGGVDEDQSTPWDLTSGGYLTPDYMAPPWLHQSLLTHPTYRQIFIDRVALHMGAGGALDPAEGIARWDARAAELDAAIEAHAARWGDSYGTTAPLTKTDWLVAVDEVRDCINQRGAVVEAQLRADGLWPTLDAPSVTPAAAAYPWGQPITVGANGQTGTLWVTIDGTDPRADDGTPSSTAFVYSGPGSIAVERDMSVRARLLDGSDWSPVAEVAYTLAAPPDAPIVLLNEYNAVSDTKFLGGGSAGDTGNGSDAVLGRIVGNGGDWFELVVLVDGADLRGFSFEVSDASVAVSTLTLGQDPLLADLLAGTIVTVSHDIADDASYFPPGGDWHINLQANLAGAGAFFASQATFDLTNDDALVVVLDESGRVEALATGEATAPAASVSSTEVFKLETVPDAALLPDDADYNDGVSSTWGLPNVYAGGASTQDLSSLRRAFGDANCDGTVNIVDALVIAQMTVGLRSDLGNCVGGPVGATSIFTGAGDVNFDRTTNIVDALVIARCEVGLPSDFCPAP